MCFETVPYDDETDGSALTDAKRSCRQRVLQRCTAIVELLRTTSTCAEFTQVQVADLLKDIYYEHC